MQPYYLPPPKLKTVDNIWRHGLQGSYQAVEPLYRLHAHTPSHPITSWSRLLLL